MILLTLLTQLIEFGYPGFCRQTLVWPAAMVWPSYLTATAFLNSMHETGKPGSFRGWSRFKVFSVAASVFFVYEALPTYFNSLSVFSWPTWIAPKNKAVNLLFGGTRGIGLNVLSLDWQQISAKGSPVYIVCPC